MYYESENFSDSSFHHIFDSEKFRFAFFYEKKPNLGCEMWKIKLQKIEWNGHLEMFNRPQAKENSRQSLLLRTDILQKTVVGCPWYMCGSIYYSKERERADK